MKLVHCHGVFDILTIGHVRHLKAAKAFGDRLLVTVTADEFVSKPGRPIFNEEDRRDMVAALSFVDQAITVRYPTAVNAIRYFQPAFFVKGGEYKDNLTPRLLEEKEAVESYGGQLVFTDCIEYHTTDLLKALKRLEPTDENVERNEAYEAVCAAVRG